MTARCDVGARSSQWSAGGLSRSEDSHLLGEPFIYLVATGVLASLAHPGDKDLVVPWRKRDSAALGRSGDGGPVCWGDSVLLNIEGLSPGNRVRNVLPGDRSRRRILPGMICDEDIGLLLKRDDLAAVILDDTVRTEWCGAAEREEGHASMLPTMLLRVGTRRATQNLTPANSVPTRWRFTPSYTMGAAILIG